MTSVKMKPNQNKWQFSEYFNLKSNTFCEMRSIVSTTINGMYQFFSSQAMVTEGIFFLSVSLFWSASMRRWSITCGVPVGFAVFITEHTGKKRNTIHEANKNHWIKSSFYNVNKITSKHYDIRLKCSKMFDK